MKLTNCIVTDNGITTIINGVPYQVGKDHSKYNEILQTLKTKNADKFIELYSVKPLHKIKENQDFKSSGGLVVGHDSITWRGMSIRNVIVDRLLALQEEGHDIAPLSRFLEKTLSLSSENAEALFLFMESKGLPITNEGDVLAYKVVDSDYKDKWTRTICNKVGSVIPEIPRSLCDSNRGNACSKGYHIGNLNYSGPSGSYKDSSDHIMIVKFNPANLVSVPSDSHENKIRVTLYEVIEEFGKSTLKEMEKPLYNTGIKNLKHGDKIKFKLTDHDCLVNVVLKYEGISSRSKCSKFYGRLLKGTEYGEAGRSASFLISKVDSVEKLV